MRVSAELCDLFGFEMITGPQAIAVAIDQAGDGGNPCLAVGANSLRMRSHDRVGDGRGEICIQRAGLGQMIQRPAFVEARHLDRILERPAASVDLHRSIGLFRDRHDAVIDLRRQRPVDPDLLFARRLALIERRIVEERKLHRALDFQRAPAFEKDRSCVRIDPPHVWMIRGIGERRKDPVLGRRIVCHSSWYVQMRRKAARPAPG